jgi:hypothetical protein
MTFVREKTKYLTPPLPSMIEFQFRDGDFRASRDKTIAMGIDSDKDAALIDFFSACFTRLVRPRAEDLHPSHLLA